MKKVLFFFLIFSFFFVSADPDEFEKLLKQCFKIKKSNGPEDSEEVNIKKSGSEYLIDVKGHVLLLQHHLKIPNNTILNLQKIKYLNGCSTQLIVEPSALLKIDCEYLFGRNISLIFNGFTKNLVNDKHRYCLNNLDLQSCYYFGGYEIENDKICIKLVSESCRGTKVFTRIPIIVAGEHSRLYEICEIR